MDASFFRDSKKKVEIVNDLIRSPISNIVKIIYFSCNTLSVHVVICNYRGTSH